MARKTAATNIPIPMALAAKVGSILGHVEEALSPGGHMFDMAAIGALMQDREVQAFMGALRKSGFMPVKRDASARPIYAKG